MIKVLATGTFDIPHVGHLDYLEYARSFGDYLVVHIESDQAVRRHKGSDRPVNTEEDRQRLIKSLKIVDQAFVADGEKDYKEILQKIRPDIFVIAPKKKFNLKQKIGEYQAILPKLKVVWFDQKNKQLSTSEILNKIEEEL